MPTARIALADSLGPCRIGYNTRTAPECVLVAPVMAAEAVADSDHGAASAAAAAAKIAVAGSDFVYTAPPAAGAVADMDSVGAHIVAAVAALHCAVEDESVVVWSSFEEQPRSSCDPWSAGPSRGMGLATTPLEIYLQVEMSLADEQAVAALETCCRCEADAAGLVAFCPQQHDPSPFPLQCFSLLRPAPYSPHRPRQTQSHRRYIDQPEMSDVPCLAPRQIGWHRLPSCLVPLIVGLPLSFELFGPRPHLDHFHEADCCCLQCLELIEMAGEKSASDHPSLAPDCSMCPSHSRNEPPHQQPSHQATR